MKHLIIPFLLIAFNSAAILHVPEDYETIQIGLDSASDGDTVLVAPGTYPESIIINRNVSLISLVLFDDDIALEETIISGQSASDFVCTISSDSLIDVQFAGFAIDGGNSISGGVTVNQANISMRKVVIYNFSGHGVNVSYSEIFIENLHIFGSEEQESRGIKFYNTTGNLNNVTIQGHHLQDFSSGMRILDSDLQLSSVHILDNDSNSSGALSIQNSFVQMDQCLISGNTTTFGNGGGIYIFDSTVNMADSYVQYNSAPMGGGLFVQNSELGLEECLIFENSANAGGGINSANSNIDINSTWIKDNTANEGGGIVSQYSQISMFKSVIFDNYAVTWGGGMFLSSTIADISFSILTGNHSGQFADDGYFYSGEHNVLSSMIAPFETSEQNLVFNDGEFNVHYSIVPSNAETANWQNSLDAYSEFGNIHLDIPAETLFHPGDIFYPAVHSELIDNGSFMMIHEGDTLLSIPDFENFGDAPDIGIHEVNPNQMLGDLDYNGQLDLMDVMILKWYIAEGQTLFPQTADFNMDGSFDVLDLVLMLIQFLQ